jgi:hypothetical protein
LGTRWSTAFFDLLDEHHLSPVQMSLADLEEDFRRHLTDACGQAILRA